MSRRNPALDRSPLVFGKYNGKTPNEVAEIDPSYVVWMYENVSPAPCSTALYEDCRIDVDENDDRLDQHDLLAG